MSNKEIFSSTGSLGAEVRQDERWYINSGYVDNLADIQEIYDDGLDRMQRDPATISRVVFRALIGEQARAELLGQDSPLRPDVEVLLPISDGQYLAYIARNAEHRAGGLSVPALVEQTAPHTYRRSDVPLASTIAEARTNGYSWQDNFTSTDVPQIADLWGPTFGWEKSEVANLQTQLEQEVGAGPASRNVWVSIAEHNNQFVAAAMAERLILPGRDEPINLIESTEWRVADDHQRRNNPNAPRLMVATLAYLNAQVLRDLSAQPTLIMAECNLRSRADRAGNGAGFSVPERNVDGTTIPQILKNNVHVQDGLAQSGDKLPHFLFQYVSPVETQRSYTKHQTEIMLQSAQ